VADLDAALLQQVLDVPQRTTTQLRLLDSSAAAAQRPRTFFGNTEPVMAKEARSFAVIGLGAFGSAVAYELARFGNHVIGVDLDERRVSQMASTLTSVVILDTTDETALREAGIDQYDVALVAIGRDIQASILTTMNLKMLGVQTLWVKASNRTHHRILSKLGADRVILPEQEMGRHIAQMLNNPVVQDYVSLGNGFSVVNIVIPARLKGRAVATLGVGTTFDLRLLGLMRSTEFRACDIPGLVLEEDDKLILLGKRPELRRFGDAL
jgi:trk system potassium uptake protein